jgi:hypothetical protein
MVRQQRAQVGIIGAGPSRLLLARRPVARPDTILGRYRKLAAHKFDGSKARQYPGRPRIKREVEELIIRMARENRDWVPLLSISSGHGIGAPMKATVADVR